MTVAVDRRTIFLNEIGVGPLWHRRERRIANEASAATASTAEDMAEDMFRAPPVSSGEAKLEHVVVAAAMDEVFAGAPSAANVAQMDWPQLKANVSECTKCGLCHGRTQTVFGVGDEKAKWLFVGEGPGRNEDLRGEPFVGQAGKLLDNMLLSMGLKRGDNAYIANIVKCRPTDSNGRDRPPTSDEAAACLPYLQRQIALIEPAMIVALGKTAAISLLGLDPDTPVSKLRGTVHSYEQRPLVVTYHPAYLLRNLGDKKKAWSDLCLAMATYAGCT